LRNRAEADPWRLCLGIALAFAALVWWRLGIPAKIMFDEVHYVPAARMLLAGRRANPEHPMVAKEAIALAIRLLGDAPWVWRVPSAVMGPVGLWAFARTLWLASGRRFATVAGTVLLAVDFTWFIQSRIAMLDMVMAAMALVMLWQVMAAVRAGGVARARGHLAVAGLAMGLSLGAKWSAAPVLVLVPAVLAGMRLAHGERRGLPIRGVGLAELALWLGVLPLALYVASFWPIAHWRDSAVPLTHLISWHRYMMQLQDSVVKHHPYQSVWWQWAIDARPIWYLYEHVDGAQRGVLLLGNPVAMLAGLPAAAWCLFHVQRWERPAAAGLYVATLGMWAVDGKPVQFYYHYLLPGVFLMACLALALDALWHEAGHWGRAGWVRWLAPGTVVASGAMFLWFFPILAALPLAGPRGFEFWMWFGSWR